MKHCIYIVIGAADSPQRLPVNDTLLLINTKVISVNNTTKPVTEEITGYFK
jgi:hypothetical protein